MKIIIILASIVLLNSCVASKKHPVKLVTVNDTAYVKLSDFRK
jgi:hypothetical protein